METYNVTYSFGAWHVSLALRAASMADAHALADKGRAGAATHYLATHKHYGQLVPCPWPHKSVNHPKTCRCGGSLLVPTTSGQERKVRENLPGALQVRVAIPSEFVRPQW